uniref:CAZy families GH76 protein n=1 Tax=uncultured Pichia TaxID=747082 RepID=A0A060CMI4_9SACH|nr:CAZy families GH76 protein [uncultured Pichia]
MKLSNKTLLSLLSISVTDALDLTIGNKDSVCNAATKIIDGIMDYYEGTRYGGTVGMFLRTLLLVGSWFSI